MKKQLSLFLCELAVAFAIADCALVVHPAPLKWIAAVTSIVAALLGTAAGRDILRLRAAKR
jgi:hypothetical protein